MSKMFNAKKNICSMMFHREITGKNQNKAYQSLLLKPVARTIEMRDLTNKCEREQAATILKECHERNIDDCGHLGKTINECHDDPLQTLAMHFELFCELKDKFLAVGPEDLEDSGHSENCGCDMHTPYELWKISRSKHNNDTIFKLSFPLVSIWQAFKIYLAVKNTHCEHICSVIHTWSSPIETTIGSCTLHFTITQSFLLCNLC